MGLLLMGSGFQFKCAKCGYEAMVSGGLDCGMVAVVRTMLCDDCRELVDVLTGAYGQEGKTGDPKLDTDLGRCPECNGTNVSEWPKKRPCPKCDGKMRKLGLEMMWD